MGPPNPLRWLQAIVSQAVLRGRLIGSRRDHMAQRHGQRDAAGVAGRGRARGVGGRGAGASARLPRPDRAPPDRRPSPAEHHGARSRARHRRLRPGGRDPRPPAARPKARRSPGQGPLHAPAGDRGRRRRAGVGGPRRPRRAYVMQDGGPLPAWFSLTCAALKEAGWLAATVTPGQAFGGDLETVTVHTGLLAARHVLQADIAVVAQGPGNLGTGTRWGFSGVAAGEAVNAVGVLGGRPVACLRVSEADPRERHRGVSHHSLTAYGRGARARADVVVPDLPGPFGGRVAAQAAELGPRHSIITVPVDGLQAALEASPARLSTMGRGLTDDLAYFLAAGAGGRRGPPPLA